MFLILSVLSMKAPRDTTWDGENTSSTYNCTDQMQDCAFATMQLCALHDFERACAKSCGSCDLAPAPTAPPNSPPPAIPSSECLAPTKRFASLPWCMENWIFYTLVGSLCGIGLIVIAFACSHARRFCRARRSYSDRRSRANTQALPLGWKQYKREDDGVEYYHNATLNRTTWSNPTSLGPQPPAHTPSPAPAPPESKQFHPFPTWQQLIADNL